MSDKNLESALKTAEGHGLVCTVCGNRLYITDHGNHEVTFHCASKEARFWEYDRGTEEQIKAKQHWDMSRKEIYSTSENGLKFIPKNQSLSAENNASYNGA